MAIDVEKLVARPPYRFPSPEAPPLVPIEISVESARIFIRAKIARYVEQILQGSIEGTSSQKPMDLIEIDNTGGHIPSTEPDHPGYRLDGAQLQDLTIRAMQEFGLRVDITDESVYSLTPHSNGTLREYTVYPSQTVGGLSFARTLDSIEATGEPVSVRWQLEDAHRLVSLPLGYGLNTGREVAAFTQLPHCT